MNKNASLPFTVSIVMQREILQNRWQSFQWKLLEVQALAPLANELETQDRAKLEFDAQSGRCVSSGFSVELFVDETPGYFLNLSADTPCWFVMWRMEQLGDDELAVPKAITLSYNEAARWMDAGEQVETLELSDEIAAWLAAYTQEYFQPEIKKKRKRPSFEGGAEVDKMARAELDRS
ncbi:MAG: DUF3305 domain-containing protein [Burkholderiales bacterium]|nr:DUF3305 domain-containing protein [Burkholderiales bacterium]